jgi:hypothetical protein
MAAIVLQNNDGNNNELHGQIRRRPSKIMGNEGVDDGKQNYLGNNN